MRNSKEIANEICVVYADAIMQKDIKLFTKKLSQVYIEVVMMDVNELRKLRKVSTDSGLIPIFKEQRKKYGAICRIVNTVASGLLSISDFDEAVKEIHPRIYDWYVDKVLFK